MVKPNKFLAHMENFLPFIGGLNKELSLLLSCALLYHKSHCNKM